MGMLSADGSGYHRYLGFNQFSKRKSLIPLARSGWKNVFDKTNWDWVTHGVFDPNAKIFTKPQQSQAKFLAGAWKTLNNGNIQYVVHISGQIASIYGRTQHMVLDKELDVLETFVDLVRTYNFLQIFIGKSDQEETTEDTDCFWKKFDGNSILLRIGSESEFKYAFIGHEVFEFTVQEPITKYVSSMGNSGVPLPYAESEHWCYDMLEHTKSRVTLHPDRIQNGEIFTDHVQGATALDNYVAIDSRKSYDRTPTSPTERTRVLTLEQLRLATFNCANCRVSLTRINSN
jgi:hypothetical protein